jgi:hypothetical protein
MFTRQLFSRPASYLLLNKSGHIKHFLIFTDLWHLSKTTEDKYFVLLVALEKIQDIFMCTISTQFSLELGHADNLNKSRQALFAK